MLSNLKHIDEFFVKQEQFKDKNNLTDWLNNVKISSKSKFNDNEWFLDNCELYSNSLKSINWERPTDSGYLLKDYPSLLDSFKKLTFFLKTTLSGIKKRKSLSLVQNYYYSMFLIDWMINNNIYEFKNIDKEVFNKYFLYVQKEKKDNKNKSAFLMPIKYLYEYRKYLEDSVQEDFFEGQPLTHFVGYKKENKKQTEAIPNDVIEKVCNKILPIIDTFYEKEFNIDNILNQNLIAKKDIKWSKNTIHSNKRYVLNVLNGIGYFVIGLYTGMRVSELMGLNKNSLEIDEKGVLILNSTLFKLTQNDKGRPEKWGCGLNNENNYALKIFKILSSLTPENHNSLFFRYENGKIQDFPLGSMNSQLKELMNFCEVEWNITTHQLRRTFARLIGITDKTCLVALKEHFKHASLAMTDYYVGTNLELIGMIDEERQQELTEGLESILTSNNLAGKLGEKISKINLKFRGNVEKRKEYINEILNNSDLIVVPHEYGFCIYQPEQAKCKGKNKNIGLNTCTKCNNFTVSAKQKVFWINRVEQYEKFKKTINDIPNQEETIKELDFEIKEAKKIITKIQ